MEDRSSEFIQRVAKLSSLKEAGVDPYPNDFKPETTAAGINGKFSALSAEELLTRDDRKVVVAGRIVAKGESGHRTNGCVTHQWRQIGGAYNLPALEFEDDIPHLEVGLRRRGVVEDLRHQRPGGGFHAERLSQLAVDILDQYPASQPRATYPLSLSCSTTSIATSTGMAKESPMKRNALILAAVWLAAPAAFAGAQLATETRHLVGEDAGRVRKGNALFDGSRMRIDTHDAKRAIVYRGDRGMIWIIDHKKVTIKTSRNNIIRNQLRFILTQTCIN